MSRVLCLQKKVLVIYLGVTSPQHSIVLPSDTPSLKVGRLRRAALIVSVYMNFQRPMCTARYVTIRLVGSYPTFSPLPALHRQSGRFFSSARIHPRERLPIKKRTALCCPDFPLTPLRCERRTVQLRPIESQKYEKKGAYTPWIAFFSVFLRSKSCGPPQMCGKLHKICNDCFLFLCLLLVSGHFFWGRETLFYVTTFVRCVPK